VCCQLNNESDKQYLFSSDNDGVAPPKGSPTSKKVGLEQIDWKQLVNIR
jgi:hypothetical protein